MFYKYIIGIANGQYMHLDIASPYILYCIGDLFFTNNENSHKIFYYHVTYSVSAKKIAPGEKKDVLQESS